MVTAYTITPEQIQELRHQIREDAERAAEAGVRVDVATPLLACAIALGEDDESTEPQRFEARERCAAILNARETKR